MKEFIVAEVSKTWGPEHFGTHPEPSECLSGRFEHVLSVNHDRGYELHSWKFSQVTTGQHPEQGLTETIIAVFQKRPPKGSDDPRRENKRYRAFFGGVAWAMAEVREAADLEHDEDGSKAAEHLDAICQEAAEFGRMVTRGER